MDFAQDQSNTNTDIQTANSFSPESNPYAAENPYGVKNPLLAGSGDIVPIPQTTTINPTDIGAMGVGAATGNQDIMGGTATSAQARTPAPYGSPGISPTIAGIEGDIGTARQIAGLAGKASQYGLFGGASGEVGQLAGEAGQLAGYAAIPLDVYNFVQNWQSGKTGSDAMQGAETGAAIGSVVPGIGTLVGGAIGGVVGAISSLFGSGATDPETQNWANYTDAMNKIPDQYKTQAASQVTNPYIILAGYFDLKSGQVKGNNPLYAEYGRHGEEKFTNDMVSQIDNAAKKGIIQPGDDASTIMNKVINPWVDSFGRGASTDANKVSMNALLTQMVDQYVSGQAQQNWKAIGGQTPFSKLPPPSYGAGSTVSTPTPAPANVPSTKPTIPTPTTLTGGGLRSFRGLAKGGEVLNPRLKTLKEYARLKGFATGGEVDSSDYLSDVGNTVSNVATTMGSSTPGENIVGEGEAALRGIVNPLIGGGAALARTVNRILPESIGGTDSKNITEQDINKWQNILQNIIPSNPTANAISDVASAAVKPIGDVAQSGLNLITSDPNKQAAIKDALVSSLALAGAGSLGGKETPTPSIHENLMQRVKSGEFDVPSGKQADIYQELQYRGLGDVRGEKLARLEDQARQVSERNRVYSHDDVQNFADVQGIPFEQAYAELANRGAIPLVRNSGEGAFQIKSPNGYTLFKDEGNGMVQSKYTETSPSAQGRGEGYARLTSGIDEAHKQGKVFVSDNSISPEQVPTYQKLANDPRYKVIQNPAAKDANGNWRGIYKFGDSNHSPVFEVYPKDSNVQRFRNGGEVTPMVNKFQQYLRLKGVRGFADGGEASSDVANADSSSSQTDDSNLPKTTASVNGILSSLAGLKGNDLDTATNTVLTILKNANPNVDDETINAQLGKNLPTILASAFKGVNLTTNPAETQRAAQPAIQKAQSLADNYAAIAGTVGPEQAKAIIGAPLTATQENLAVQKQALENQGIDVTNLGNLQVAQQHAIAAKNQALGLGQNVLANDPNSAFSKAYVAGLQKQLTSTNHPGAAQVAQNLDGMSAVQADAVAKAVLGAGEQAATIRNSLATAALTAAQTPGAAADSAIRAQAAADYLNRSVAGTKPTTGVVSPQPAAGAATGAPTPVTSINSVDGLPQRHQLPSVYSQYRAPADIANEQSNSQIASNLNSGGVDRNKAIETLDGMISAARSLRGPTGFSPSGQQFLAKFDPQRQQFHKFYEQYVSAIGGSGTNQQQIYAAGGVPSYETFSNSKNIIKDLLQLKARLLKTEYLNQALQERARAGDLANAQPSKTYAQMQTYELQTPQGKQDFVFGPSQSDQQKLAQLRAAAKSKGLPFIQID